MFLLSVANADTVNYSADTTGEPTWNRTFGGCANLSGTGTAVSFHTQVFSISSNDSCTLTADETQGQDMYLHLYTEPFDPNNQFLNCVNDNDDGGIATNSEITSEPLVSGQTYVMVTSGFGNADVGTFDASISCPTATVSLTCCSSAEYSITVDLVCVVANTYVYYFWHLS